MPTSSIGRPTQDQPLARMVWLVVAAKLALHLAVASNYGFFRDELYYLAAGRHLDWGFVDFPPFVALLAAVLEAVAPGSLVALHLPPALAGAAVVVVSAMLARELGGGAIAQVMAALAVLVSVAFLATGAIFSMDVWDQLWWSVGAWVLARLLRRDDARGWLAFGAVAAVALLTKLTVVAFGSAVVVGVLLSAQRRHFATRWPWLGGGVALVGAAPYLLWNATHGWPTLEFWRGYGDKLADASVVDFLLQSVVLMNPATLPLWLAGLVFLLVLRAGLPFRPLGVAFLVLLGLFGLAGAKVYFLAPAFTPLFAAGAVWCERLSARLAGRVAVTAYAGLLVLSGAALAPLALPLLQPADFARAYGFLGEGGGTQIERHEAAVLPQWLADRFGWPELVETVATAYHALPAADREQACIFTSNYGEAGAIDLLGRPSGLPSAISGHNSYHLWGPGGCTGAVVLTVGMPLAHVEAGFRSVLEVGRVRCSDCMPYQNNRPVYLGRGLRMPLAEAWPELRHFD